MKIKQSVFVTNYPSIECEGFQGHLFKTKFKRLRQLNTKTPAQETRAIINFPSSQQCSTQLILYFWEVCDFHLVLLRLDLQQIWEHYHYFWSFDISTGPTGVEFETISRGNNVFSFKRIVGYLIFSVPLPDNRQRNGSLKSSHHKLTVTSRDSQSKKND